MLGPGQDTVGTVVHVRHLGAAPMGTEVTFRATISSVEDRRVNFQVEAFDSQEKIGEGTHERFIINVERFGRKMLEKLAR
jgi:predicted thioesterase